VLINRAAGKAAEKAAEAILEEQGFEILGRQVAARVGNLGRRVIDLLVRERAVPKNVFAVEVKAGNAVRNAAQLAKDAMMENQGCTLVGKNAPKAFKGVFRQLRTVEMRL
jgi:Holliday junction resolvase-like predicted endonuclease